MAAAIGGAILGAAAVAAFALSDRDTRDKLANSVSTLRKKAKMPSMPNLSMNYATQGTKHGVSRRRRRTRKTTMETMSTTRGRKKK